MFARKIAGAVVSTVLAAASAFMALLAVNPITIPYCGGGCDRSIHISQILSAGFAVFGVMLIAVTVLQTGLAPWRKTLLTIIVATLVVSIGLISWATTKGMNPMY